MTMSTLARIAAAGNLLRDAIGRDCDDELVEVRLTQNQYDALRMSMSIGESIDMQRWASEINAKRPAGDQALGQVGSVILLRKQRQ